MLGYFISIPMRLIGYCFFTLLLSSTILIGQNRVDSIRHKLLTKDTTSVLVVAHRGDWRDFPENSMQAIESAISMGVDIVEVDIQRTRDGVLVLMHDKTIDRTTTGKGLVSELTIDSLQHIFLRNGCAIRTKYRVPTLEEVLKRVKGRVMLNLDKAEPYLPELYELLERTKTIDHVIIKGAKSAKEIKTLYAPYLKKLLYMPIVSLDKADAKEHIRAFSKELQPVAFELTFRTPDNPLPYKLKEELRGKALIWYNTLWDTLSGGHDDDTALDNPDKVYGHLIDNLNANIIQTDRPRQLLDYLKKRGLH